MRTPWSSRYILQQVVAKAKAVTLKFKSGDVVLEV